MVSLINWGISFLAVFVVLVGALFAAAPGFVRKDKGTSTESVSVWMVVCWSVLFSTIIIGSAMGGMMLMDRHKSGKGFGCGCGPKWGVSKPRPAVTTGYVNPALEGWAVEM